jgi:endo-1,4-beta-xylanase
MLGPTQRFILAGSIAIAFSPLGFGQTLTGGSLSHRSSGSGSSNWTLSENGYVGTYFSLAAPGAVTLSVNASGATNDATIPQMNLVVADTKVGFEVTSGFNNYQHTFDLPAGTYFVRTEFNNDVPTASRQLTVGNLTVSGATVSNTTSTTTNNANALAAADTYIEHFRQGPAHVELMGAAPGMPVEVQMTRNAFNFGTMVQGFDANVFLAPVAPGDTTSTAARYQNFVKQYFNILVPSNMGKWAHTEPTQGNLTLQNMDTILNFAQANDMNVRMHNLIWGNQQPTFVNNLIASAQSSNPAISGPAKAQLMTAIATRIAYYVGDGDGDTNDGDRSRKYLEIDVLNEALRNDTYWDIFGAEGVAQIYGMVQDAVEAAGADTRLYTNEYNVFNYANDPDGGASDPYANWYRRNIEDINNAGFGEVVTGVGIQYNSEPRAGVSQAHSPARMNQVLQNLSVTGLPITITEFSVPPDAGGIVTTEQRAALIYNEALRMTFGNPLATSFLIWEPWPPANTDSSTIFDNNWNLRAAGQELVNLLDSWTTPTQNLLVGPDGTIDFTGFFGEYEITVDGKMFVLDLTKGTTDYSLLVGVPGDFDDDLDIDAADLAIWHAGYGVDASGDADFDGDSDGRDFLIWQRGFQNEALSAAPAIPEPTALALGLLAVVWGALVRSRWTAR